MTRKSRADRPVAMAVGVLIVAVGLISCYRAIILEAPFPVPVTDFGRDLFGARAAQLGVNPYQTLGELSVEVHDWIVPAEAVDYWVAHSPVSIAFARGWLALAGPAAAESLVEVLTAFFLVGLLCWIWWCGRRNWSSERALVVTGGLAATLGFRLDAFWLQGAGLAALLVAGVFTLEKGGRHKEAIILLGVVVAWRPWLAPLAFVLPSSRSGFRDAVWVALVSITATFLALPWVGGVSALRGWLLEALPANLEQYHGYEWNLSLTALIPPALIASVIYLALCALLPVIRRQLPTERWPQLGAIVILGFTPLVWSHYLLAIVAMLVYWTTMRFNRAILVLMLVAWPLASLSPLLSRLTWWAALVTLVVDLIAGAKLRRVGSRLADPADHPTSLAGNE